MHRCLTRHALLYTEIVTAEAVLHGDRGRLLGFDPFAPLVALQLGGSDPAKLAEASRIAADFGYDEINLNVGYPSDRMQSGRFGAQLERLPTKSVQRGLGNDRKSVRLTSSRVWPLLKAGPPDSSICAQRGLLF